LLGLCLQVFAAAAAIILSLYTRSPAVHELTFLLVGGIPLWFVAVLVFRQHELAALEAMDLEELRRERQSTGGGEAMFTEQGGAGFLVAQKRLEWMRTWLIPVFGLISAVILIVLGIWAWLFIRNFALTENWPNLENSDIGLILVLVLVLLLFFYSRYAAGLGRVSEWQLLRGCGSYMLAGAMVGVVIAVTFAYHLYQQRTLEAGLWEHYVAQAIPLLMIVIGIETALNFVFDIYRPRSPGTEPRACFDSRILGLFSETGGITHSLKEAINYQFGFQVSQTWFFQLLERTLTPLLLAGGVVVWLLTCILIVQPYERVILERFGRQYAPEHPLEPGLHFKWPAPFEVARRYNTGQLHEFVIGYEYGDTPATLARNKFTGKLPLELWTDEQHAGRNHFDFITASVGKSEKAAVNTVRMAIHVAYKIRDDKLAEFTQNVGDPHAMLRRLAWNEIVEYAASSDYEQLMGEQRPLMGRELHDRLAARVDDLGLGLEIVYVGAQQVHPVKEVAEAFRAVVNAQQQQIADVRIARVEEDRLRSYVAGDPEIASDLADALDEVPKAQERMGDALRAIESGGAGAPTDEFDGVADAFRVHVESKWRVAAAAARLERAESDLELGVGQSPAAIERMRQELAEARDAEQKAIAARALETAKIQQSLAEQSNADVAAEMTRYAQSRVELAFWSERINELQTQLEGESARFLAEAQSRRWEREMGTAGQVIRLGQERMAYDAAPEIYKVRSYLDVFVEGLGRARKYFLAFDPGERKVHVRLETQEQARPDLIGTVSTQQ
jgi:regulator of protease activity HflC (stomatin/prohibitin superfamily)